ncbi:MAG: NADH-quinone oxidoreductase subunit D [bacterium]|nr:NADH-quinone oxidoreductase subunit D [bacterium]
MIVGKDKDIELNNPVDVLTSDIETEEFEVNMGPQHPSTHGVLRLVLKLDGEVVKKIIPYIGYLHRNHEKIAENRTYMMYIPYSDRLDYVAAMNMNMGYCSTVEKLAGIQIPDRAEYIRVIMCELNRIASHLVWLGTYALDIGAWTPLLYCFREREKILDLFEMTCGQRLTYNYFRIGGVNVDLPLGFIEQAQSFVSYCRPRIKEYEDLLSDNVIFVNRTKGIGVLSKEMAINYGVTGPNLRASGVNWDVRKNEPYSIYHKFNFTIPTGTTGDCWDRYIVRIEEMRESLKIVEQALETIPAGEVIAKVPRVTRPPVGELYFRTEAPRGELGFYIVSDGTPKPERLKIRAACFSNLSVLPELARGWKIADIVAIGGSLDMVMGELDR